MATPSQLSIAPGQHQHQGLGTSFREAPTHPGSTTLDDIRDLLQHLGTAIAELTQRVAENEEATKHVQSTVENISQAVDSIAGKIDQPPRTPPQAQPIHTVDKTPRPGPSGKQRVKLEPPANIEWHSIHSDKESKGKDPGPTTGPSKPQERAATISIGAASRSLSHTPGRTLKPIKVKAPEPFKGGSGAEAKQ
ncbi:hypothetical protein BN14_11412 [Rhizoctonia solani AG-1 IB]|nr:hypothetical protein BN14_11412 [Rhizoctonia solani AG-1 IB]